MAGSWHAAVPGVHSCCLLRVACDAGEITSAYSDLDLDKCETLMASEEDGSYEGKCLGHGGNFVMVWEGDLRQYIAYGPRARSQCASAQTFGHFNHFLGSKLEWRLDGRQALRDDLALVHR